MSVALPGRANQKNNNEGKNKKMIRQYETLEGHLTNGLTWKIETENGNRHLTILWANGEELETIEIMSEDLQRLADLFNAAYAGIAPSKNSKAVK